jgi:uncharacterized membrane protein YkvA (DUF1232 family)
VRREAFVFCFALKHSQTPWYAKLVAACTVGYLFSPIQFIPSFIPVIGFLDDLLVVFLGLTLLRRITPPGVLSQCRELAKAAESRGRTQVHAAATLVAGVVIAMLWLFAAVAGTGALMSHLLPRFNARFSFSLR